MSERYLFPFEKVNYNSKIVLYGAGICGQAFYQQVQASQYCEIVIWLDRNADEARHRYGVPAYTPENVLKVEYDYVVVAIANKRIANCAAEELCKTYQIDKNKIITNVNDLENYKLNYTWEEYAFVGNIKEDELAKIAPKEIVSLHRLDVAVRWMLCRDFVSGIENDSHISLYTRMQLARIGGEAGKDYWTDNPKENVQDMLNECKKLCLSMKTNGFQKNKAIPLSARNHLIIDGSHRLATSLALEESIWIKYYENVYGGENYGFSWFIENGFNTEDLMKILRAYCEICPRQLGIVLLYGPVLEQWEYIQAQLRKQFAEVGWIDVDFFGNFYAYEELIREIYYDASYKNPYNDFKLKFLEKASLKIRVLLLEELDEHNQKEAFYARLKNLKNIIRGSLYFDVAEAPCIMHSSDNPYEFSVLKNLFLSPNNMQCLKRRVFNAYSDSFLERLERAKLKLDELGIPQDACAIVGSSVLEIFGLRTARDLDIIVHSRYRYKFAKGLNSLEKDIEIYQENRIRAGEDDLYISDDVLIDNDEFHFMFHGWKIVNLEIYKAHTKWHLSHKEFENSWEKKKENLRKIELFEQFCLYFDDKEALHNQIEKEYFRKRFA